TLEVQGSQLFWAGYMYDEGGKPVWYISSGPLDSPTSYTGPLLQLGGGQTMSGDYRPPDPPVSVGTLNIEFAAINEATMTFSDDSDVGSDARTQKRRPRPRLITPKHPPKPPFTPPPRYTGTFTQTTITAVAGVAGAQYAKYTTVGKDVTWNAEMTLD